jgi:hypothetical protein
MFWIITIRNILKCYKILGLPNEPKWSHLRNLHKAIKQCEPALLSVDPTVTNLGSKNLEVNSI